MVLTFFTQTSFAQVSSSYYDCLGQIMKTAALGDHSLKPDWVSAIHAYNDQIKTPFAEKLGNVHKAFNEALTPLHTFNPGFPKEEFLKWNRKNKLTMDELSQFSKDGKTLGEVLHERVQAFAKTKDAPGFEKATQELSSKLTELREICGGNVVCQEKEIAKTLKGGKFFSCLRNDKDAMGNMIRGFAISNAGLAASEIAKAFSKDKYHAKDIPYDLFLNGVLWTPIFAEVGCRGLARKEANMVGLKAEGKKLSQPQVILSQVKMAGVTWLQYMKWSPIEEASYMAFHIADQKYIQGEDVKTDPKALANELVMYMKYDAQYSVPRMILLTDPLFNRVMPRQVKPYIDRLVKNEKASYSIFNTIDAGAKVGVSAINTRVFKNYEKSGGSFAFLMPSFLKSKTDSSAECLKLKSEYEKCLNQGLQESVPSGQACDPFLKKYEQKCGPI